MIWWGKLSSQKGSQGDFPAFPFGGIWARSLEGKYLEDHPTGGSVVSNHGDRKSPNWGCSLSKWPKGLLNGGDPNYLLTGMILQVTIVCLPSGLTSP